MLRSVIVSPDVELANRLEELIGRSGRVMLVKSIDRYLASHELERFMRANAPQLIFIGLQELNRAIELYHAAERIIPGLQVIAIDRSCDSGALLTLMHNGIREFLAYPSDMSSFASAINRVGEVLDKKPARIDAGDNVFCFLPSKAGAGTSTISLNTAVSLSKAPDNKTLLVDLDLNSGMIGFMLRLESGYTVYEAAENSAKLDEHLWPQLISSVGGMDVLPAGRLDPQSRVEATQIRNLIGFARRFYKTICVDLSGNMEKYSLEVLHEAKRIFLVCTPEIPTLHLARQKLRLIQDLDLGERVSVLLNRAQKRPMITTDQIEQLLGIPVTQEFPNDYRGVHEAVTHGREIAAGSELGKGFTELARKLMSAPESLKPKKPRKGFFEMFSMAPRCSVPAEK